ncbi:MAG TPA: TonB-dependent receptor [Terriglobia bacterium]|nr:TonB-dependent receptor [Terriglobia bacterium]
MPSNKGNGAGWIVGVLFAFIFSGTTIARAFPQTEDLNGEVVDEKSVPIMGAVCTLTSDRAGVLPEAGLSQTTSEKGLFAFPGLEAGTYHLVCAAIGHEPVEQNNILISNQPLPLMQIALPVKTVVRQQVEVHDKISSVAQQSSSPPARLSAPQLQALPLAQQKFKAALPLVPGVLRLPDGRISIKGAGESQGMLLVDSADTVDPVTGSFSIDVPLDAVESMEVYKSAYNAQYGRFSGGLTSIETKPPSGQWHFEVNDFVPTPRIRSGEIIGIADDRPRVTLTGPLWANHLNFSESFTYDMGKQPVRGLAWPNNEIKTEGLSSFSSFQYIFAPNHLMTVNANVFPLRREFANIDSLIPQTASSNYGQRGVTFGATDRYLLDSGAVATTLVQVTEFDSYAHGQGPLDMLVTPNGYGGNYFNSWTRTSHEQEISEIYQLANQQWLGKHELKVGADYVHRSYDGTTQSRPVELLRTDGSVAERIDFSGPGNLSVSDTEWAGFVQDHWSFNSHLGLDAGLRYSGQVIGTAAAFAPRVGLVYSPGDSGRTIFRGGVGVFYDRIPLLAGDFVNNPTRTVSTFNDQGLLLGPPITYENVYVRVDEKGQHVSTKAHHLSSTPYNVTWNMEMDRELGPRVLTRISYLSSRTYDEFIIDPENIPGSNPVLLLTNTGGSRYHEFESTVRIHASERTDFNISYIYSLTHGDMNTLGQIYVPFEQPVIRPNVFATLPANVPHRVVTWGRFKIPWAVTATPLLDVHTGFPYSNVDVLQNYVGIANNQRFPAFFSLDLKLSKDFNLPLTSWLKNHKFRGAFQIYNLTNHSNPLDVYSNVASPYFGHFVGFQHRLFDVSFDIVY